MIVRIAALFVLFSIGSAVATAQFAPPRPTPLGADEIFADRAMRDAASLSNGQAKDIISADDGIDLQQAERWHRAAFDIYQTLCDNRSAPRDVWARNCAKLADMHRRGLATPQDYETAATLYLDACKAGLNTNACLQQAYIDHRGVDGETNWPRAKELYRIACDRGDPSACAGLGNMLYRGQAGLADRVQGAQLLQESCRDGYAWACERLTGFGLPRQSFGR